MREQEEGGRGKGQKGELLLKIKAGDFHCSVNIQ